MEVSELYAILDSAGDAAMVVNLRGEVCYWSARAETLLGLVPEQVMCRHCAEVLAGRDESGKEVCRPECRVLELARTRTTVAAYDLHAATAWGPRKWLNISVIVVPTRQNSSPLVVHLMRDIDERKQIENSTREILVQIGHLTGEQADEILGRAQPDPLVSLTPRELAVLRYLARGSSTSEISASLGIRVATIRNHIQHLIAKLDCHTRLEAVLTGIRRGLIH